MSQSHPTVGQIIAGGLAGEADQNGQEETLQSHQHLPMSSTPTVNETYSPESKHEKLTETATRNSDRMPQGENTVETPVDESGILTGARLYLVFLSMMLSVFMFALDQSIVSTAIPVIVSDFQAFDQVSWIITAYFLTQCGLILLAGQLLTVVKSKWILLGAIFFFELGSLLCGVSKSMNLLIFGRAVQGIGASGMFVSILAVITVVTKVEQRAAFMSTFGLVFVISSVCGPLLGGVFTQRVSWRWCFYINLPFGGFAAIAVFFLLPAKDPARVDSAGEAAPKGWKGMARLDYVGSALIMSAMTCLLLALQWGGNEYAWGSWRIILLFTLGGVLILVFGAWEVYRDTRALIPLSILKNRTEVAGAICLFMMMLAMLGGTYQLPLFYQAGRNHSPEKSGIDIIAFMLSVCVGIFISGGMVTKFGYYLPFIIAGPPIAAVGFGLLYTITEFTANSKIIGFQILAGFGIGICFQNVMLAIQAEFHDRPGLLPQATGVLSFFQLTGGAIGVGIVNTVQSVFLNKTLKEYAPNVDFALVRQSVAAIYTLPVDQQPPVVRAYVESITKSFVPIYVAVAISLVAAVFIKNHNMLKFGGVGATAAV